MDNNINDLIGLNDDQLYLVLDELNPKDHMNMAKTNKFYKDKINIYYYYKSGVIDEYNPDIDYMILYLQQRSDYNFTQIMIHNFNGVIPYFKEQINYPEYILDANDRIYEMINMILEDVDREFEIDPYPDEPDIDTLYKFKNKFLGIEPLEHGDRAIIRDFIVQHVERLIDSQDVSFICGYEVDIVDDDSEVDSFILSYILFLLNAIPIISRSIYKHDHTLDRIGIDTNNIDRARRLRDIGIDSKLYYPE